MKKLTVFAFVSLFLTAILAFAGTGSPALGARAVNPQPLPPGIRALNPQPLPPGAKALEGRSGSGIVALNPQPLPPGMKALDLKPGNNQVNPQPLPPGGSRTATGTRK